MSELSRPVLNAVSCRSTVLMVWLLAAVWCPLLAGEPKPFPDMMPKIGEALESDYYDRTRFQARLMVERALRRLNQAEPGLLAQWSAGSVTLLTNGATTIIPAAEPTDLAQAMMILEQVRLKLEDGRYKQDHGRELSYALINGALTVLDPHTEISAPDIAQLFREDMAGEFFGIGAFLHSEEGLITVDRVIPGTPAERAGIEDGDLILSINGEKTAGMLTDQAVKRIRGPKGTTVVLTVERKAATQPLDIPVVRDLVHAINLRAWRNKTQGGDIAYIRLDEFHAHAAQDVCSAYVELQRDGPFKALVLDMRFNGGGLLDQAKAIGGLFLDDNAEIVRTVTVDGRPAIFKAPRRSLIEVPVVVLVSPGTASAAEIVSGALQRNDRALVAGRVTFGKGTVQTLRDLDDDSRLRLTIQEYQLPGGVSIQDVGVMPDLDLIQHTVRDDGRIDLLPPSFQREGDNEFALINRSVYRHQATYRLGWLARQLPKDERKKESIASREFTPDQEALLVIDLLQKTASAPDFVDASTKAVRDHQLRQWLLERLKEPLAARAASEAAALAEAFAKQSKPIVWGAATTAVPDSLSIAYTGPASVDAGTTADLTFAVTNQNDQPIGRLYGVVHGDKLCPLWEDEVVIGEVGAHATVTATLPFAAPLRLFSGEERFTLDLYQDGTTAPIGKVPVQLTIVGKPRPHLKVAWQIEEADATRDNKLDPDEKGAKLVLIITNDGAAKTGELDVRVFKDNDRYVELGTTRFDHQKALEPNESMRIESGISVKKELTQGGKNVPFTGESVKVQMVVQERLGDESDARFRAGMYRASLSHALTIPVGTPLMPEQITPPALNLESITQEGANRVRLRVKVVEDRLRHVGCFIDEDKVDLRVASAVVDGFYTVTLSLKPGIHNVQIYAIDENESEQFLPLRLWGSGEPAPAKPIDTRPAAEVP